MADQKITKYDLALEKASTLIPFFFHTVTKVELRCSSTLVHSHADASIPQNVSIRRTSCLHCA